MKRVPKNRLERKHSEYHGDGKASVLNEQTVPKEDTLSILGYNVYACSTSSCVQEILKRITEARQQPQRPTTVACLNPHSYAVAKRRADFESALRGATLLIPDGIGISAAARITYGKRINRITGMDIFLGVSNALATLSRPRVMFFGSTEATLDRLAERYKLENPTIEIVGMLSPSFGPEIPADESRALIRLINQKAPDVLWVAMTAPKQEVWLHNHLTHLTIPCAIAIGAVFDYYARSKAPPPDAARKLGLEWLFRLLQEPKRLWRRTLISMPIFLCDCLLEFFNRHLRLRTEDPKEYNG